MFYIQNKKPESTDTCSAFRASFVCLPAFPHVFYGSIFVFKGTLIPIGRYLDELDVSCKNVWFTLEDTDGELIYNNHYRDKDNEAWNFADQETIDFNMEHMPMAMRMPHTPGYEHVTFIPKSDFPEAEDKELVLTFENPYSSSHAFSECVIFTLSQGDGAYLRASKETLLPY